MEQELNDKYQQQCLCVVPKCFLRIFQIFFFRQHSKILSGRFQIERVHLNSQDTQPSYGMLTFSIVTSILIENSQKLGIPTL